MWRSLVFACNTKKYPDSKIEYLDKTDKREPRQKTHRPPNRGQNVDKFGGVVLGDPVKGRGVEENSDKTQVALQLKF